MEIITGITTKNEDWIIDKTLCAVNNFVDKIIIYDDGSTDKTEEICRSYDKVEWFVRPSHNEFIREEAKQRMELINIISDFDPNYILLLDADEIPTPSIVNFINNIDESVTSWKIRMVNLWGDEGKYRYDSFITDNNVKINNDPFSKNSWCKYPLFKFEKGYDYTYNLGVQKGGCSPYHPSPKNLAGEIVETEDFYIMHYGQLSEFYMSGDKQKFYSKIEEENGIGTYENRLNHHMSCAGFDKVKTKETNPKWFW